MPDANEGEVRGSRYPTYGLGESVGFLRQLHESMGEGPFSREAIGKGLGHESATSGTAFSKVGALNHFNLISGRGTYSISAIGRRILYPTSAEDERAAMVDAFKSPNLYGKLLQLYGDKPLPKLLSNLLIQNYGVSPSAASVAAKKFVESAEFAGLLRNGILCAAPAVAENAGPTAASQQGTTTNEAPSTTTPDLFAQETNKSESSGKRDAAGYTLPLSKGRIAAISLPLGITAADIDRIKKWLDVMTDILTEAES